MNKFPDRGGRYDVDSNRRQVGGTSEEFECGHGVVIFYALCGYDSRQSLGTARPD
jgi:hypothetical protein